MWMNVEALLEAREVVGISVDKDLCVHACSCLLTRIVHKDIM